MLQLTVRENISSEKLTVALNKVKTELVHNKRNLLIEKIKKTIVDYVYYSDKQIKTNFSDYLAEKLDYHYTYMANLFSKVNGTSLKHFLITTRIERVKELLIYDDLTLTQIASKLHYSSVTHLSSQFKKVTGITPSKFVALSAQNSSLLQPTFPRAFHVYSRPSINKSAILPLKESKSAEKPEVGLQQTGG
ncbi:MAG TPA: helix-turn-helix transcriptional regulator [Bacteroidia bacterium]|jgi:AraC-like DNA-binding protein|nr:helix-turn-helix transcriptional regulator [Bacteroidia bacterium]